MADDEYDIHPLDRDYSQPQLPAKTARQISLDIQFNQNMRKAGVYVFCGGLVLLFLSAILVSNFRGGIEVGGSALNKISMIIMLAGAVTIVLAYRIEAIKTFLQRPEQTESKYAVQRATAKDTRIRSLWILCLVNIGIFAAIWLLGSLVSFQYGFGSYLFFNLLITMTIALMATMIVFNRGHIRGYAIGVCVGLVWNLFSSLFGLSNGWGMNSGTLMLSNLGVVLISGLVCGAYVMFLIPSDRISPSQSPNVRSPADQAFADQTFVLQSRPDDQADKPVF